MNRVAMSIAIILITLFMLLGCTNKENDRNDQIHDQISEEPFNTFPTNLGDIFPSEWPEDGFE